MLIAMTRVTEKFNIFHTLFPETCIGPMVQLQSTKEMTFTTSLTATLRTAINTSSEATPTPRTQNSAIPITVTAMAPAEGKKDRTRRGNNINGEAAGLKPTSDLAPDRAGEQVMDKICGESHAFTF